MLIACRPDGDGVVRWPALAQASRRVEGDGCVRWLTLAWANRRCDSMAMEFKEAFGEVLIACPSESDGSVR